jgi:hypothetical protein
MTIPPQSVGSSESRLNDYQAANRLRSSLFNLFQKISHCPHTGAKFDSNKFQLHFLPSSSIGVEYSCHVVILHMHPNPATVAAQLGYPTTAFEVGPLVQRALPPLWRLNLTVSMSRGNGYKPSTPESIYFNPFAEDRQTTTAIDVSYLSDSHHRPAVRRRGSGSDSIATTSSASSSSGLSVFANTPRHLRVKTDGPVGVMASGGHHPLRSADLSSSFRNGAGITRPQLTRIVNIPPLVDAPPVPGADMIIAEPAADEKVVLVHEVR